MSNPDNAVGTNAAYSGRTSVNAFNDGLATYSRGILSGWNCQVSTGLTVILGGSAYRRDVAIAQDNAGNKTTINNISGDEVPVTLEAAPGANSRIDAIVAYVDNPPQGNGTDADNPGACGIIAVTGTPAVDPVEPNESAIRAAITADGASGATAYYVVLAKVTVPTGTTDLIAGYIEQGAPATINDNQVDYSTLKRWVPDYAQKGSTNLLQAGTSTTLTETGFIYYECAVYLTSGTSPHINVTMNDKKMDEGDGFRDINNALAAQVAGILPAVAGDTFAVSYNTGSFITKRNAYFVPGRWV